MVNQRPPDRARKGGKKPAEASVPPTPQPPSDWSTTMSKGQRKKARKEAAAAAKQKQTTTSNDNDKTPTRDNSTSPKSKQQQAQASPKSPKNETSIEKSKDTLLVDNKVKATPVDALTTSLPPSPVTKLSDIPTDTSGGILLDDDDNKKPSVVVVDDKP